TVEANGASKPFLTSIGERAEALARQYEDRLVTTRQALLDFQELAQQYVDADAERQRLGVDENAFATFSTVRRAAPGVTAGQAVELSGLFERHPDWQWDQQQKGRLRAELYKALRPLVGPARLIDVTNTLMRLQRV